MSWLLSFLTNGPLSLLLAGFWLLMIYDCVKNDPEKNTWLWLLIFLNVPGAIIYFLVRRLPQMDLPVNKYFGRWTRSRELWIAEANTRTIGKAHQFIIYGNLLCDVQMFDKAEEAYKTALEKEPKNLEALWGVALVAMQKNNFVVAKEHLQQLLALKDDYKYGDASLAYGQTLMELQDIEAAKPHLEKHLRSWGHPEAYMSLANILIKEGNSQEAARYLETMLSRIKASSYFHYRKNQHWVRKGEKLLRSLKR